MDLLDRQLEHDRWATAQILERCRQLPDAQRDQPFDIGRRTLRETLSHLIFVVTFLTALMDGQPAAWEHNVHRPVTELIDRHERFYATFAAMAGRMREEHRLNDTFGDNFVGQMTFGGAIIHVIPARLDVPAFPEVDHALWDLEWRDTLTANAPTRGLGRSSWWTPATLSESARPY